MERFHEELSEGKRRLHTADHLLSITYPLVRDNRLLLTAVDNLHVAARNLMASLLHYEEAFKRVPHFRDEHDSMLYWFRSRCMPNYKLGSDYGVVIDELNSLVSEHKASAVEFSRKDSFVICSDTYSIKKVTLAQLKSYAGILKKMLMDVEGVVSRYEGVFGRGPRGIKAR
ncbi:hypothetical protein HYY73_00490 [Candidatus Woesearchaeota archaeon]|nr:hypothetical protein [Candidatus Woesearchaeota archaeon]